MGRVYRATGRWDARRPLLAFGAVFLAVLLMFPHLPLPWFRPSAQVEFSRSSAQPGMPGADTDGDGLFDNIERKVGTSYLDPDTDDDDLGDGDEYKYWTTRHDKETRINETDHWLVERHAGETREEVVELYRPTGDLDDDRMTNIVDRDSDQDSLLDGEEIDHGTDPANPDSDGDGIIDSKDKFNLPPDGGTINPGNHSGSDDYTPGTTNTSTEVVDPESWGNVTADETRVMFWVEPADKPRYWRTASYDSYSNSTWEMISPSRVEYTGDYLPAEVAPPPGVPEDEYRITFNGQGTGFLPNALHATKLYERFPNVAVLLDRLSNFYCPAFINNYMFTTFVTPLTPELLETGYLSASDVNSPLTSVPASVPARVKALALAITEKCETPFQKVKALLSYLKGNYDFVPEPLEVGAEVDRVDHFLFSARQGSGLEFASAFTILCRANGIPARFVTGFALGDIDHGRRIVRSAHFHAWSEVKFENLGWVQFETTTSDFIKSPAKVGANGSDPTVGDINLETGTVIMGGGGGGSTQNGTVPGNVTVQPASFVPRFDVVPHFEEAGKKVLLKGRIFEVRGEVVGPSNIGGGATLTVYMNSTDSVVGRGRAEPDGTFTVLCNADQLRVGIKGVGMTASKLAGNVLMVAETPVLARKKVELRSNTTLDIRCKDFVIEGNTFYYSVRMRDDGNQLPPNLERVDVFWNGRFLDRVPVEELDNAYEFEANDPPGPCNFTAVFSGSPYLYASCATKVVRVKSGGLSMRVGVVPDKPVVGAPVFVEVVMTEESGRPFTENVSASLDGEVAALGLSGTVLRVDLDPSRIGAGIHELLVKFNGTDLYPELSRRMELEVRGLTRLLLPPASISLGSGRELWGSLRDNLDRPLAGAKVVLRWLDTAGASSRAEKVTFSEGDFKFRIPVQASTPPGTVTVSATFDGDEHYTGSSNTTAVQLTSPSYLDATVPANLTRGLAYSVNGTLWDHLRQPIMNARVVLELRGEAGGFTWTDGNGSFQMEANVPLQQDSGPAVLELRYPGEGYREPAVDRHAVKVFARSFLNLSVPRGLEQGGQFELTAFLTDDREAPVPRENVTLFFAGSRQTRTTDTYGRAVFPLRFPYLSTEETVRVVYRGGEAKNPASASKHLTAAPTFFIRVAIIAAIVLGLLGIAYLVKKLGLFRRPEEELLEMLDRSWISDRYRKTVYKVYLRMLSRMRALGAPRSESWTVREYEMELRARLRLDLYSLSLLTLVFEEARYSRHAFSSMDSRRAVASYRQLMNSLDLPSEVPKLGRNGGAAGLQLRPRGTTRD